MWGGDYTQQFTELWEYCKETFALVRRRPFVFVPRLVFNVLLIVLFAVLVGVFRLDQLRTGVWPVLVVLGGAVSIVVALLLEAGQVNLHRAAALGEAVDLDTFWEGIPQFVGRVVGGMLLMFVILLPLGLLFAPLAVIPGLGLLLLPVFVFGMLAVNALFSLWQASVALDDVGVFEAFGNSYRTAQTFFWPLVLVTFVRSLFTNDGNNSSAQPRQNSFSFHFGPSGFDYRLPFNLSPATAPVLMPALLFGTVLFALVSVLVTVFLDQLFFTVYVHRSR